MPVDQYIGGENMQFYIFYIRDFFMRAIGFKNSELNINEPFQSLFTQVWFVTRNIKMKIIIG